MTDPHVTAAAKKDNLFGICNAVSEDLGINPLWPRLVFASAFMFDPVVVISSYFALGAFVLIARLVFPRRSHAGVVRESAEVVAIPYPQAEQPVELARAA